MRPRTAWLVPLAVMAIAALGACGHDAKPESDDCTDVFAPGVVRFLPGLDVVVRDARGQGQASGATVVVYSGVNSIASVGVDTLHVPAGFQTAGTFSLRVSKPYYQTVWVSNVVVRMGHCSVDITAVPVTLQLAPGAPPVRSLDVFGPSFLEAPGVQQRFVAKLDADPGVSNRVIWRLSDTTVAHIDGNGVLTAKCTPSDGSADVIGLAAADTTARGSTRFWYVKRSGC